jgi:xylose dehydrogenase (NAD/NADP)
MDIGIYPLNTARFLLDADPVRVQGSVASVDEAFADVPDEHVAFQVGFPEHTYAACTASQNAHTASHVRVTGTAGEVRVESAFFPWDDRRLHVSHGDSDLTVSFDQIDQMEEEFEYFAHCLLAGTDPHADGEHGLVDVRTIKAVYDAAERDRAVALD